MWQKRQIKKPAILKNRGFKDQHYKDLFHEFIYKYGSASKEDISDLILDLLSNVLDKDRKENKVRNLIYAMSKQDKSFKNVGTKRKPIWKRNS